MWEKLFNLAISNGIWAVLFLALFIYQLRDSKSREQKYQNTIDNLATSLQVVKEVKDDVTEIKTHLNLNNSKEAKRGIITDEKSV